MLLLATAGMFVCKVKRVKEYSSEIFWLGVPAAYLVTPADVIKTRLQVGIAYSGNSIVELIYFSHDLVCIKIDASFLAFFQLYFIDNCLHKNTFTYIALPTHTPFKFHCLVHEDIVQIITCCKKCNL